ncbi:hypothetical protein J14TS5_40520 [Paenibacillus lautus]|nr:hypothetical protein J14TS5_40520 [Paenibacillus lautus]
MGEACKYLIALIVGRKARGEFLYGLGLRKKRMRGINEAYRFDSHDPKSATCVSWGQ